MTHNKGLHQTKGARSGRFAAGHLEAPFAGEARCSPDAGWRLATRMTRTISFLSVAFLLPSIATPCQVERVASLSEATSQADAVFVGRVVSIKDQLEGSPDPGGHVRRVVFDVREVWKGSGRRQLAVWTMPGEGVCGVPFVKDAVFLVFAAKSKSALTSSIAWPSARLPDNWIVPAELGQIKWRNRQWR